MTFCIGMWAVHLMKSLNIQITEGMELPNQERIRTLREKEMYMYLGLVETDTIKETEMN